MIKNLKKGDKVRIIGIRGHAFNIGEVVEFIEIVEDNMGYFQNKYGRMQTLDEDDIELIGVPSSGTREFEIGDKVRVLNNHNNCFNIGEIVTYVGSEFESNDYWFGNEEGIGQYLAKGDFELITEFKVGDRVEVIEIVEIDKDAKIKVGDFGTIVGKKKFTYKVNLDKSLVKTGRNGNFNPDGSYNMYNYQLKLVENKCEFKVGDKVRLNTDEPTSEYYSLTSGMINKQPPILTISDISTNKIHGVRIKVEENSYRYHPSWLELVEVEEVDTPNDLIEKLVSDVSRIFIGFTNNGFDEGQAMKLTLEIIRQTAK